MSPTERAAPTKSRIDFDAVLKLGASLPGVKASSGARGISLKLKGQLVACTAINRSVEPNSLMVCIDFPARDCLLEQQPDIYYITSHYRRYATVLVFEVFFAIASLALSPLSSSSSS